MYKRLLVPVDGSGVSLRGLDEAVSIIKGHGRQLRVLHVIDGIAFAKQYNVFTATDQSQSGNELIQRVMANLRKAERASGFVAHASAASSIVKEAKKWRADVVVMGTYGRGGMNRVVLGSNAEIVLRIAPVPVLLVRTSQAAGALRSVNAFSPTSDSKRSLVGSETIWRVPRQAGLPNILAPVGDAPG